MKLQPIGSLPPNSYFFVTTQVYVIDHAFNAEGVPKTKLVMARNIKTGKRWLMYETKMVQTMPSSTSNSDSYSCFRNWLWKQLYRFWG